jgi:hypothetical protein
MCAGAAMGAQMGRGQAQAPATKNYGYGAVGQAQAMAGEERQWYIDQGFGDPNAVIGSRPARNLGRFGNTPANAGYYQGVSPEARYLYTQSSMPKTVYLQERAPSAATSLGVPANTRYAGKSLTINPVTS